MKNLTSVSFSTSKDLCLCLCICLFLCLRLRLRICLSLSFFIISNTPRCLHFRLLDIKNSYYYLCLSYCIFCFFLISFFKDCKLSKLCYFLIFPKNLEKQRQEEIRKEIAGKNMSADWDDYKTLKNEGEIIFSPIFVIFCL